MNFAKFQRMILNTCCISFITHLPRWKMCVDLKINAKQYGMAVSRRVVYYNPETTGHSGDRYLTQYVQNEPKPQIHVPKRPVIVMSLVYQFPESLINISKSPP